MLTDQSPHASLSDSVLSEKPPSPPAEGNTTAALETAKALLAGKLPLAESLGLKLEYTKRLDDDRLLWLFQAEGLLQDYSERDCRNLAIPSDALDPHEEGALCHDNPDPALVAKAFNAAALSTLSTLTNLAEESDALSYRFRARLCVACREELAVLLSEHAEMTSKGVA